MANKLFCANAFYNPINEFMVQMGYLGAGSVMCSEINKNPSSISGIQNEISQLMSIASSVADTNINIGSDINSQMQLIVSYCLHHPNSPLGMAFLEVIINATGSFVHGNTGNFQQNNNIAPYNNQYNNYNNNYNNYNTGQQNQQTQQYQNNQGSVIDYSKQPRGYYNNNENNRKNNPNTGMGIIRY